MNRIVNREMWPAVGQTLNPNVKALSPIDGQTMVPVYLCRPAENEFVFKFDGTADCTVQDGTFIPVIATIGGEGDGGVDGGKNFGVYKQRYLARPTDVPYANDHWAVQYLTQEDKDRDFLILPVYMVQDGNTDPSLGPVAPKFYKIYPDKWLKQTRTISRLCSSCHATGLQITIDSSTADPLVTSFRYKDLNITCERCHGPGSEHRSTLSKDKIIVPRLLTAKAAEEACGQCHAAHSGSSKVPRGAFKMPFNANYLNDPGYGSFVTGLYELEDFIEGIGVSTLDGGGVETWPDRVHTLGHDQMLPTLRSSKHANNPYERLACFDCHEPHSLRKGPASFLVGNGAGAFDIANPDWRDNTLCLGCHAGHGPFEALPAEDVAIAALDGHAVTRGGQALTASNDRRFIARSHVARAVGLHMQEEASMGVAAYDPNNDANPVGRCTACHMPKTGKKNDTVDLSQWHLGRDANGHSAIAEGNCASHTFDVIWPWQSVASLQYSGNMWWDSRNVVPDLKVMPNSCSKCHAGARLSGDAQ